jgi:hypothetical protein
MATRQDDKRKVRKKKVKLNKEALKDLSVRGRTARVLKGGGAIMERAFGAGKHY